MKKNKLFAVLAVLCFILSGCAEKSDVQNSDSGSVSMEKNNTEDNQENEKNIQELIQEEKEDAAYEWYI